MKTYLLPILILSFLFPFCVSAQTQPPNGSFEVWDSLNPQSWVTNNNNIIVPAYPTVIVLKDTINPYHGNNAMELMFNWVYPAWASTTFSNTGHPSSLDFHVKCIVFPSDTVSIRVEILNNGTVVDTGYWGSLTSIDTWTKISIPISQSATGVSETRILITGGRRTGPADETSTLAVDGLTMSYAPVQNSNIVLAQNAVEVFPNPSSGVINIKSHRADLIIESISLYHLTGVKILETKETTIDTKSCHMLQGTYYLSVKSNKGYLTKQLVIIDHIE